jgi:biopolymer transport protein ExbD
MALKTSNKINVSFSMSSMTDLVFLLLIFFMITSTMVSPNALKLLLPQSSTQVAAKVTTTVSITPDLQFFVETTPVPLDQLEGALQQKLAGVQDPTISIHAEKSVPVEQLVNVMRIAMKNKYKIILATSPEQPVQ